MVEKGGGEGRVKGEGGGEGGGRENKLTLLVKISVVTTRSLFHL